MPTETLQLALELAGALVAFLLGRELVAGYRQRRASPAENPVRRDDD
jgi:hypothetical protein